MHLSYFCQEMARATEIMISFLFLVKSEPGIPGFVFQIGFEPTTIDILTSIDGVAFADA